MQLLDDFYGHHFDQAGLNLNSENCDQFAVRIRDNAVTVQNIHF